ncbi:neuralized-like protein 4 [Ischnura elegans]|uniref:neuralized-like protein 4 n=1 Tax=Ischnura elegans TaxID=197161 RepID=UPI001ED88D1A|nr:neuralized-like protein 4 [Ischnura elegans]
MHAVIWLCAVLCSLSTGAERDSGACWHNDTRRNVLKISFDRRLNESDGQWVTRLSAIGSNSTAPLTIDATHDIATDCGSNGKGQHHVEIIVKDGGPSQLEPKEDNLHFHHRHHHNVVLFNEGKSAKKIDLQDLFHGTVFTNRPLKDNEIFEVRLDQRTSENVYCHGIGVMVHSPDDVKFYDSMYRSKGTWIIYGKSIYGEDKNLIPNYGADSCKSKVGETIGVMKRSNGSLHFFVNGVDQGPATTIAPSTLYGVYEVRGFATGATIVSRS